MKLSFTLLITTEAIAFPKQKVNQFNSFFFFYSLLVAKLKVHVVGDWLPRSLFGSFHLLCAAIRSIYLAVYLLLLRAFGLKCDAIVADQITFHLPLLKLCSKGRILFYCHFPDKLLAPSGSGRLCKFLYRKPLDWAEEWCLQKGSAKIVVNSQFTLSRFQEAFKSIHDTPEILYPGVAIASDREINITNSRLIPKDCRVLLSLNRFERKKNINLAIESLKAYKKNQEQKQENGLKLIVAGGFDSQVVENLEHLQELQDLCDSLDMKHTCLFRNDFSPQLLVSMLQDDPELSVIFLPSISQECKVSLLQGSLLLIYTPSNEHFGIVPIEAMAQKLPVIAMNSGGPKETVLNGKTGFLCEPQAENVAIAIEKLLTGNNQEEFGRAGQERVKELFSLQVFERKLNEIIEACAVKSA